MASSMSKVMNYFSILILWVLAFSTCSANKITLWTADPVAWPSQCVTVYGAVVDDNGDKVPGVTVATYGASCKTNAYGIFTHKVTASSIPNGLEVVRYWFPATPDDITGITIRTMSGVYNVSETGNSSISYAAEATYVKVMEYGWYGHTGVVDVYGVGDSRWRIDNTRTVSKQFEQGTYLRIEASEDATVIGGAYSASGSQNAHCSVTPVTVYTWVGDKYPSRVMRSIDVEWGIMTSASSIYQTDQEATGVATVTFIPPPDVLGKLGNSLVVVTAVASNAGNQLAQNNDVYRDSVIKPGSQVISTESRSVLTIDTAVTSSDSIVEGTHTPCQATGRADAHVNTTVNVGPPTCL